mgnify:CR=1 FL=1
MNNSARRKHGIKRNIYFTIGEKNFKPVKNSPSCANTQQISQQYILVNSIEGFRQVDIEIKRYSELGAELYA